MQTVEEYLRDFIEGQLFTYEQKLAAILKQGSDGLTPELRKLIARRQPKIAEGPKWELYLLGKKLRELTSLNEVSYRLQIIRMALDAGDLIKAHQDLTSFEADRSFVEGHSYKRPLRTGFKSRKNLDNARETANGSPIEQRRRWKQQQAAYDEARAAGALKVAAYDEAAAKCHVDRKTIIRTIATGRGKPS